MKYINVSIAALYMPQPHEFQNVKFGFLSVVVGDNFATGTLTIKFTDGQEDVTPLTLSENDFTTLMYAIDNLVQMYCTEFNLARVWGDVKVIG